MAKIYDFNRYAQKYAQRGKRINRGKRLSSNYGEIIRLPRRPKKSFLKSIISPLLKPISIILLSIMVRVKDLVVSPRDLKKHRWKTSTKRMGLVIPGRTDENKN